MPNPFPQRLLVEIAGVLLVLLLAVWVEDEVDLVGDEVMDELVDVELDELELVLLATGIYL